MSPEPVFCQPHSVAEPCRRCNAVPASTLNPEALARLREAVRVFDLDSIEHDPIVSFDDLRALLDAYDTARAELSGVRVALQGASPATLSGLAIRVSYEIGARKAVLRDLQAVERERDTARAEGVAAERARVVAAVKKRAWMLPKVERQALLTVAERLERGLHDKEGT